MHAAPLVDSNPSTAPGQAHVVLTPHDIDTLGNFVWQRLKWLETRSFKSEEEQKRTQHLWRLLSTLEEARRDVASPAETTIGAEAT